MLNKIHHLGIAVKDIEGALALYRDALGLECAHTEELAAQKVKTAMLPIGDTKIELLEPTDPQSPVGSFIEQRGGGIHHLAVEVDDIEAALKILADKGIPLIHKEPQTGVGGTKIAFLHPKGTGGVLLELVQNP